MLNNGIGKWDRIIFWYHLIMLNFLKRKYDRFFESSKLFKIKRFIQQNFKKLTNKNFSKKYISQFIIPIINKINNSKNQSNEMWKKITTKKTETSQNEVPCSDLWEFESRNTTRTEFCKRLSAQIGTVTSKKPAK